MIYVLASYPGHVEEGKELPPPVWPGYEGIHIHTSHNYILFIDITYTQLQLTGTTWYKNFLIPGMLWTKCSHLTPNIPNSSITSLHAWHVCNGIYTWYVCWKIPVYVFMMMTMMIMYDWKLQSYDYHMTYLSNRHSGLSWTICKFTLWPTNSRMLFRWYLIMVGLRGQIEMMELVYIHNIIPLI